MFTVFYKGYYINGYILKNECSIISDKMQSPVKVKSIHAAKCIISRWVKLKVLHL
jgi:hypothetical protein